MKMKNYYLLLTFLLSVTMMSSQDYKQMISEGTYTVQEIQSVAEAHFAQVGTERGKGYKPYKRWEYQALRHMDENGMLPSPDQYYTELQNYNSYLNENIAARTTVGAWEQLGPESWNATSGWNPGVGRITSVAVEPANPDHIIAGADTGGVWRSTDGGLSWVVLTDNLANLNVSSLTIHPTINTTYYWGSTSGTIFISTDSGSTWNILADTGNGNVNKLLIDPTNTNKMYCSVQSGGIYKSTDAGISWSKIIPSVSTGYDIEFKPGDTNIVFATGTSFYVSLDGGNSFVATGGFSGGPKMIGVSPDDPTVIYVLEASGGAFGALYKSVNFSPFAELNHAGKNYFGYSSDPEDAGDAGVGQAPRDMDIAINPNDVNDVHIAGVNSWRSTNGGITFSISSQWTPGGANGQNIGYCHADIDLLEFVGNPTDGYKLYVGSDGGLYVAENPTVVNSAYYKDLTAGMGIRQFYKIGISQTDPVIVTGGAQDNGTSVMDVNGDWTDWLGADGMESFVDKNDPNILYGTSQNGSLYKSLNGGLTYSGIARPENKTGNWITPFEQDPIVPNVIYSGYDEVYKSTNGGTSWTSVSDGQDFGGRLNHLKIAPSNSNYQFAARGSDLFRNAFVGTVSTWSSVGGFSGSINSIAIHPTDPNRIAIATTGSERVYVSLNGGNSWTSYKFNLPSFSAQALAWHDNGENGLYLGMDYGVYYIDDTYSEWQPFSNGLPNVYISELEVNTANNKLYAGTYGRGLWTTNVFDASLSVDEFALESFEIYPNPAKNEVSLKWNKSDLVSVKIFDALGKLMYFTKNINISEPTQVDVSNYASGLYFVRINNLNGFVTKKLIIE
jgi:photosystem II stability/assembly factor-like uncharacterized protein